VSRLRPIGRASVRRPVGRAKPGRAVGVAPTPDRAKTEIFEPGVTAPPVFVDASGRRRRNLRWISYAVGLAVVLALLVLWLTQLGDPVRPNPVTPCTPVPSAAADQGGCARR
jgi:hypothetical protein